MRLHLLNLPIRLQINYVMLCLFVINRLLNTKNLMRVVLMRTRDFLFLTVENER